MLRKLREEQARKRNKKMPPKTIKFFNLMCRDSQKELRQKRVVSVTSITVFNRNAKITFKELD